MKVLVMASSTGLSHLARSLELARYLQKLGIDVRFACGSGHWRDLAYAYGLIPLPVYEPRLSSPKTWGIGIPKSTELTKSFNSDINLMLSIRPDVVVADWRLTAWASAKAVGVPIVQIWNANWGILACYASIVNSLFIEKYYQVITSWKPEIDKFLSDIGQFVQVSEGCILNGDRYIIPDHIVFRDTYNQVKELSRSWVGPLVPWPMQNDINVDDTHQITHDITIAFGGHSLPPLERLIKNAAQIAGLRFLTLSQNPPEKKSISSFSFFPSSLRSGRLVVTHGGIGSIYQSLLVGKPLLVIPQHLEQLDNGQRVEQLGVGICLSGPNVNCEQVNEALNYLLNKHTHKRAVEIGQILRSSQPLKSASQIVMETAQ